MYDQIKRHITTDGFVRSILKTYNHLCTYEYHSQLPYKYYSHSLHLDKLKLTKETFMRFLCILVIG